MNIPENFDRWMFDYMEGNLSGAEQEAFENFLVQHPEFEIEADAWNNSVIEDENLTYPNQSALEKDRDVVAIFGWSAAAMLILLMGIGSLFVFNGNNEAITGFSTDNTFFNLDPHHAQTADHDLNKFDFVSTNDINDPSLANGSNNLNGSDQSNWSTRPDNNGIIVPNANGLAQNSNQVNAYQEENYFAMSGEINEMALEQEASKFSTDQNNAKYSSNPESGKLNFDVSRKKSNVKYNSFGRKVKNMYKKIERSLNSPIGITNLRDPDFGIAQNNILSFNPGFAGGMLTPRFEMNYRNQWFGSGMNVQKASMSFDFYSKEMRGGVGLVVNATDYGMGAYGDYNASLFYSPKFVINQNVIFEPAIKLTLGAMNANGPKLTPNSGIELNKGRVINTVDAVQMTGQNQLWYKDYGLGFMLNTKWFYLGFNADNLAMHYENVYGKDMGEPTRTPINYTALAGFDYESHDSRTSKKINRSLSPYVLFQQFGDNTALWAGSNFRYDWLTLGASYSTNKEYTASIGLQFERFKMIYRYDMTESVFLGDKIGSHNIGIRINAKRKNTRPH